MHLITGRSGTDHITSANDGFRNSMIFGAESFVFDAYGDLKATKISNNKIRISEGQGIIQGRLFENVSPVDLDIINGTEAMKRNDLIVVRYEKNTNNDIETVRLVVITGERATDNPVDPEYYNNSILNGATIADFPIYRVKLNGITATLEQIFELKSSLADAIENKVDRVLGKGLSSNDFTDELKSKYDAYSSAISNKVDKVTGKGLSTNDFTTAEKNNLASIISKFTMSSYFSNLKLTNDYVTGRCFSFSVDVTDEGRSAGGQLSEVTKFSLNFTNSGITLEQLKNGTWSTLWSNH